MFGSPDDVPPPTGEKTSALLRRLLIELPPERVRIGYIARQLRRRSFGGLLLLLATLALFPVISVIAGLAMIVPGLQMLAGFRAPRLPRAARQREIKTDNVRALGNRVIPWVERLERVVKPRWLFLTSAPIPSLVGLLVLALAPIVMLPLPFSNLLPAIALLFLALGLIERDGILVLIGLVTASIALIVGTSITYMVAAAILPFFAEHLR